MSVGKRIRARTAARETSRQALSGDGRAGVSGVLGPQAEKTRLGQFVRPTRLVGEQCAGGDRELDVLGE